MELDRTHSTETGNTDIAKAPLEWIPFGRHGTGEIKKKVRKIRKTW